MEVYIDGGIKKGSDIFKCLALGADFVFLGRGFLFSVIDGEEGVQNAFKMLTDELKRIMMLCGANSVKAINMDFILSRPTAKL
jgi:isopentenyl diphosphate isomerase/L-lactate dehydrogenase-like FMN-dependent dehydrogenase